MFFFFPFWILLIWLDILCFLYQFLHQNPVWMRWWKWKMNELYLLFFLKKLAKKWLKYLYYQKRGACFATCNLLLPIIRENHCPKTQIPSSIKPTFFSSFGINALYICMCTTQCKQMEMCNSAVLLSLNICTTPCHFWTWWLTLFCIRL